MKILSLNFCVSHARSRVEGDSEEATWHEFHDQINGGTGWPVRRYIEKV